MCLAQTSACSWAPDQQQWPRCVGCHSTPPPGAPLSPPQGPVLPRWTWQCPAYTADVKHTRYFFTEIPEQALYIYKRQLGVILRGCVWFEILVKTRRYSPALQVQLLYLLELLSTPLGLSNNPLGSIHAHPWGRLRETLATSRHRPLCRSSMWRGGSRTSGGFI